MWKRRAPLGVTLIELMIVVLILSILATIAVSVYSGHVQRARFAVARMTIRELEVNAQRYEIDTGSFPLSSSGTSFAASPPNPTPGPSGSTNGCGYLMLCLLHSYSGNANVPADPRWQGPYMEVDLEQLGNIGTGGITRSTPLPQINLLDPWGYPYHYVRNQDYAVFGGTEQSGLPTLGLGETYYNPSTVQIYSVGPDGVTLDPPNAGLGKDDINNFNTQ